MNCPELLSILSVKDMITFEHCLRVCRYTDYIVKEMPGSINASSLHTAAMLHDFGKLYIDEAILSKPSCLCAQEWKAMESHPRLGALALTMIGCPAEIVQLVLHHHIRYDGKGYPPNSDFDDAPLEWFIIPVADAYDAMTHIRPYKCPLNEQQTIEEIRAGIGTQFHPGAAEAFIKAVKAYPEIFKVNEEK